MNSPRILVALLLASSLLSGCSSLYQGQDRHGPRTRAGKQHGRWQYYYMDATPRRTGLKARGFYRNDRQVGRWNYWYDNEQRKLDVGYVSQRLGGLATYWHENGQKRAQGFFDDGQEHGLWSFWTSKGELVQRGSYQGGKRAGRWTFYYPDGAKKAEGFRLNGQRVGLWKFWSSGGELVESRFDTPEGYELVCELWQDGSPRREGFRYRGANAGPWIIYHQNGNPSLAGEFRGSAPAGVWVAYAEDGTPISSGPLENGAPSGEWSAWTVADAEGEAPEAAPEPAARVTALLAERLPDLKRPGGESAWTAVTEASYQLDGALRLALDRRPLIPIPAQPWTVNEEADLETLDQLYSDGKIEVKSSRYRTPDKKPEGDKSRSERMLDKPLPVTTLKTGAGEDLDLANFQGKKKVLVVILRGYDGYVCVYCATQVRALQDYLPDLADRNVELVVVYPGEKNRLDAFLESYRTLTEEDEEEVPFTMAYDPDFALRDALKIQGALAIPTTLILNESGIVRYAYVGEKNEDRPSAKALLTAIDGMQ